MPNQKVVGGICEVCGGKYVQSPKTGKIFCANKCWLNNQVQQAQAGQIPFVTPAEIKKEEEKKWQEISTGKVRTLFALEAYKAGKPLDVRTASEVNIWVDFCMTGKLSKTQTDEYNPFV